MLSLTVTVGVSVAVGVPSNKVRVVIVIVQQTTNDCLQKTDTYRPITRPVFVQPDLSQGYYYPDFDEASATSLRFT